MAASTPITRAPARAPAILAFPMPPMRQFRMELAGCFSRRMIDRWLARIQRTDSGLTEAEYHELALRGLERGRVLAAEDR